MKSILLFFLFFIANDDYCYGQFYRYVWVSIEIIDAGDKQSIGFGVLKEFSQSHYDPLKLLRLSHHLSIHKRATLATPTKYHCERLLSLLLFTCVWCRSGIKSGHQYQTINKIHKLYHQIVFILWNIEFRLLLNGISVFKGNLIFSLKRYYILWHWENVILNVQAPICYFNRIPDFRENSFTNR